MSFPRGLLGRRAKQFVISVIEGISLAWISLNRRFRSPHVTANRGTITVYGFFESASGLGAAVRGLASAIAEWRPMCESISQLSPSQTVDVSRHVAEQLSSRYLPMGDNAIHLYNPDVFAALMLHVGPKAITRFGRNLVIVNWETDRLPSQWTKTLSAYQILAAPSTFTARAIRRATGRPVSVIPNCVPIQPTRCRESVVRHFQFLVLFDALSSCYRKNPLAALQAFRQAIRNLPEGHTASLIIKCHSNTSDDALGMLRRASVGLPITLVAETVAEEHMQELWASTDCLVNLHRSEGFGLAVAEALARGIPVITTKQGGVLDFTDDSAAFLVPGSPISEHMPDTIYGECSGWVEPNVAAAAVAMSEVVQRYEVALSRALRGRQYVYERLSKAAVKAAVQLAFGESAAGCAVETRSSEDVKFLCDSVNDSYRHSGGGSSSRP